VDINLHFPSVPVKSRGGLHENELMLLYSVRQAIRLVPVVAITKAEFSTADVKILFFQK
jgi:hypothetical protein